MDDAYARAPEHVLQHFQVEEHEGLCDSQVVASREKYGSNGMRPGPSAETKSSSNIYIAIAEEPPTPIWELILEQFKDQLVIILLASAGVSFVLALFEEDGGWTAFVDPAVVCRSNCTLKKQRLI